MFDYALHMCNLFITTAFMSLSPTVESLSYRADESSPSGGEKLVTLVPRAQDAKDKKAYDPNGDVEHEGSDNRRVAGCHPLMH